MATTATPAAKKPASVQASTQIDPTLAYKVAEIRFAKRYNKGSDLVRDALVQLVARFEAENGAIEVPAEVTASE